MNLLIFIGAIAILIIIHELGHFVAARLFNVEVEEFGIGFPPRILTMFRAGGTDFSLNWIPLGGFVRPKGENDPEIPGGLAAASPWVRIGVLIAGPLMNLIAGVIIFSILFFRLGDPILDKVLILEVANGSPAAMAQLQAGDQVLSVNGEAITSTEGLRGAIYANLDQEIEMVYDREGNSYKTSMTPRSDPPQGEGATGIVMGNPSTPIGALESVGLGTRAVYEHIRLLFMLPSMIINREIPADQGRLVGYKGMYDIFSNLREIDQNLPEQAPSDLNTLNFLGSITISLALLNLLPLPALDGGRILFALPEILLRKRIPQNYENVINLIGFSLLILLMIYVNIQDFVNPINTP